MVVPGLAPEHDSLTFVVVRLVSHQSPCSLVVGLHPWLIARYPSLRAIGAETSGQIGEGQSSPSKELLPHPVLPGPTRHSHPMPCCPARPSECLALPTRYGPALSNRVSCNTNWWVRCGRLTRIPQRDSTPCPRQDQSGVAGRVPALTYGQGTDSLDGPVVNRGHLSTSTG